MLPEEEAVGLVDLLALQEAGNPHAHLLHARVLPHAILRPLGLLQLTFYLDKKQGTSSRILNVFAAVDIPPDKTSMIFSDSKSGFAIYFRCGWDLQITVFRIPP
jgi:hypothetical protein